MEFVKAVGGEKIHLNPFFNSKENMPFMENSDIPKPVQKPSKIVIGTSGSGKGFRCRKGG